MKPIDAEKAQVAFQLVCGVVATLGQRDPELITAMAALLEEQSREPRNPLDGREPLVALEWMSRLTATPQ